MRHQLLSSAVAGMMIFGAAATHAEVYSGSVDSNADASVRADEGDVESTVKTSTAIDGEITSDNGSTTTDISAEGEASGSVNADGGGSADADADVSTAAEATADMPSPLMADRIIVDQFERQTAFEDVDLDDGNVLQNVGFDVVAYINHPCYSIASEAELEYCQGLFGQNADLSMALQDGTLAMALNDDDDIDDTEAVAVLLIGAEAEAEKAVVAQAEAAMAEDEDEDPNDDTWERSNVIWSRCGAMTGLDSGASVNDTANGVAVHANLGDWRATGACFQSGMRLIKDVEEELDDANLETLNDGSVNASASVEFDAQ